MIKDFWKYFADFVRILCELKKAYTFLSIFKIQKDVINDIYSVFDDKRFKQFFNGVRDTFKNTFYLNRVKSLNFFLWLIISFINIFTR